MLVNRWVQTNLTVIILGLMAAILVAFAVSFTASAEAANTLKVTPVRSDIEIKPGGRKVVQTTVSNLTNETITLRPVNNDFISGDERGTPALILDADKFAPTHSLKRFMEPMEDVTLQAGESKTVEVVINVPQNAQAGGYFGAVRFAPANPDGGGQVNMSASAASLILLTVPGDAVEKLDLTEFKIIQNGETDTIFHSPDNLMATFRFESKANVQLGPMGKISVTKGDEVVFEQDFNSKNPRDMVLPDSARRWDVELGNIGNFGKYTVNATFTYGSQNKSVEVSQSFWVIPWSVIIGALVGLLVLIGLVVGAVLLIRNRRRRSMRSNSRGNGGLRRL